MNVIVFASRKGGSGKSTLAAHLAAHVHKATKPCLMIDADPQGSLTLWHKLRGTNEPPIKAAVNSVSGIIAAAKRDGIEWVFIDTPPNLSAVVDDAIKNATMVIIPARPGVFDVNAVQETIQTCRAARKPYAVVINGAPARRDGVESRIVTIAREALIEISCAGVERSDHQPRRSVDGARPRRRRPRILCGRPRGSRDQPAVGRDRTFDQGDPRYGVGVRRDAQAGGVTTPPRLRSDLTKKRAGSRAFFFALAIISDALRAMTDLRHHQHVEHDDRRQGQDHRPDADRPENVLGRKALLFRDRILFSNFHERPRVFVFLWDLDRRPALKTRSRFRSHLTTSATAD